jgi:hypothetical protein
MSLRRALAALPDDRDTATAIREVVAFFNGHRGEAVDPMRVARATGLGEVRVAPVLRALFTASVVDCDGDSGGGKCTYEPDGALDIEVRRFLRVSGAVGGGLQRRVDRFRGSYGSGS